MPTDLRQAAYVVAAAAASIPVSQPALSQAIASLALDHLAAAAPA